MLVLEMLTSCVKGKGTRCEGYKSYRTSADRGVNTTFGCYLHLIHATLSHKSMTCNVYEVVVNADRVWQVP
jgi:hypothetical protein